MKDTFARTKPHYSLSNSMTGQWMQEVKDVDDLDAQKVLETVSWSKGRAYPLRAALDTENSEDNEDGTYAVAIEFDNNSGNLAAEQTDEIWAIIYNPTTRYIDKKNTGNTRADGLALVNLNIPPSGTSYIAFCASSVLRNEVSTEVALCSLTSEGVLAAIE